jgi:tetratricopeptide (TPR) repeat protein
VEDPASAEDLVPDRCFEQVLHGGRFHVGAFGSVIVAVLAGIENAGKSLEGGVGDLGEDGGLPAGLVPQDLQVERVEHDGAGYYYGQARAAAHEADDDTMCAMVLANWSQLATWAGDPRLGVEHALGAVAWGQRAGSRILVSYGCDVGARAYAAVVRRSARGERRADHGQPMHSLEQAYHELDQAPDSDPGTGLAYFYDQGQYLATRTWCLLELGDPHRALATASQSLASADPAFVRNVALTRLALAGAYAQMGEPGNACEQITQAADLAGRNNSPRLIRVLTGSRQQLSPWDTSPDVASLDERLRTLGLTA